MDSHGINAVLEYRGFHKFGGDIDIEIVEGDNESTCNSEE